MLDYRRLLCHNAERSALGWAALWLTNGQATIILVLRCKHILQEICQGCIIASAYSSVHLDRILNLLCLKI